ncbi:hypothetical protein [Bradyrhizobium sp. AZCC 2289]|uniref:hypothetical protein n=1 Tax=Bradyrhizobium sp. AZCC 2289 TaxID=3117026 RepID=UPI002FEE8CEA
MNNNDLSYLDLTKDQRPRALQQNLKEAYVASISPDGEKIAVGYRGEIALFDANTERSFRKIRGTFLTATTDDAPALEGYRGHGVFTYALLDALDHADVNKNGLIEVSELADYIDQKVPDFSFEAFKLRQIPQRSIVGNNFALTNKAEVLTTSTGPAAAGNASPTTQSPATAFPAKPTHVVIAPTPVDVFERAHGAGASLQKLPAGTLVTVVRTADGWTFIAKDGKSLGYIAQTNLAPMQ